MHILLLEAVEKVKIIQNCKTSVMELMQWERWPLTRFPLNKIRFAKALGKVTLQMSMSLSVALKIKIEGPQEIPRVFLSVEEQMLRETSAINLFIS